MLRDTEFFKSRISKVDGAGDIGDHLVNIVNAKAVAAPPEAFKESDTSTDEPTDKQQEADVEKN